MQRDSQGSRLMDLLGLIDNLYRDNPSAVNLDTAQGLVALIQTGVSTCIYAFRGEGTPASTIRITYY